MKAWLVYILLSIQSRIAYCINHKVSLNGREKFFCCLHIATFDHSSDQFVTKEEKKIWKAEKKHPKTKITSTYSNKQYRAIYTRATARERIVFAKKKKNQMKQKKCYRTISVCFKWNMFFCCFCLVSEWVYLAVVVYSFFFTHFFCLTGTLCSSFNSAWLNLCTGCCCWCYCYSRDNFLFHRRRHCRRLLLFQSLNSIFISVLYI